MKNNKNIMIIVAVVVLLVIGVGYYYSTGESTIPGDAAPAVVSDETTNPEEHTVMKPTIPPDDLTEETTPKQ